jgi:hypothetical protein
VITLQFHRRRIEPAPERGTKTPWKRSGVDVSVYAGCGMRPIECVNDDVTPQAIALLEEGYQLRIV